MAMDRKGNEKKKGIGRMFLLGFLVIGLLLMGGILFLLPVNREDRERITYCNVDGTDLAMFVSSTDAQKPVLLFLGGGPGIPEYFLEKQYPTGLEELFTVCYMEYRGNSLSYAPGQNAQEFTTERYLKDVEQVTDYLCHIYHKDRIYLMGHSFGTYIGLLSAKRNPDKYIAYISMAQNTDQQQSEYLGYDYMLEQYQSEHNDKMEKEMLSYRIRESEEEYNRYFISPLRDKAMHALGVGTARTMHSVMKGIFYPSLVCRAYTLPERINIWRGKLSTRNAPVVADGIHFNAFREVPSLEIPIYFFTGVYDYTCNHDLQVQYYEQVKAPKKELFLFEHSAHSPIFEEPKQAREYLQAILQDNGDAVTKESVSQ